MKLVNVAQMKAIEAEADASGLSYAEMMANAGACLADAIQIAYRHIKSKTVLGLVGSGNNGGDTLIGLTHLTKMGWESTAFLAGSRELSDPLIQRFMSGGGRVVSNLDETGILILDTELAKAEVILDGILGTGFQLPMRDDLAILLAHLQDVLKELPGQPQIVAVDCPSGVNCDTGEAEVNTLQADRTICMAAVKTGLMNFPAASLCGEIVVVDIGLPEGLRAWQAARDRIVDAGLVKSMLPPRKNDSHKGTFGTAVIAAGSLNYTGAALLAGTAAYLVGTGLVCMAVPQPLHAVLAGHLPEAIWLALPHTNGAISQKASVVLASNLQKATALLIGPGIGSSETTGMFFEEFLDGFTPTSSKKNTAGDGNKRYLPYVIDADGINLLSRITDWRKALPDGCVLTPHPGEMAGLTGLSVQQIQANRIETAREWAARWGQTVVLKGAYTVIASPKGRVTVNPLATAALARAGTGDVLAGMIAGFMAQGIPAEDAAIAGVYLHGRAALAAMEKSGSSASVLAGDILKEIGSAIHTIGW